MFNNSKEVYIDGFTGVKLQVSMPWITKDSTETTINVKIDKSSLTEQTDKLKFKIKIDRGNNEWTSGYKTLECEPIKVVCPLVKGKFNVFEIFLFDQNDKILRIILHQRKYKSFWISARENEYPGIPFVPYNLCFGIKVQNNFTEVLSPIKGLSDIKKDFPYSGNIICKTKNSGNNYLDLPIYKRPVYCIGQKTMGYNPALRVILSKDDVANEIEDGIDCEVTINVLSEDCVSYRISIPKLSISKTKNEKIISSFDSSYKDYIVSNFLKLREIYSCLYGQDKGSAKTLDNLYKSFERQYEKKPLEAFSRLVDDYYLYSFILEIHSPFFNTGKRMDQESCISRNPYRIIGVFSNGGSKEIQSNINKIQAFSATGRSCTFPLDKIYQYSELERTVDNVNEAYNKLSIPNDRINYSLFWFCSATQADKDGLESIKNGDIANAEKIWLNQENFSAFINLAICYLIKEDWENALLSYEYLLSNKVFFEEFIRAITKTELNISKKEIAEYIVQELMNSFPKVNWIAISTLNPLHANSLIHSELCNVYYDAYKKKIHTYIENFRSDITQVPQLINKNKYSSFGARNNNLNLYETVNELISIYGNDDIRIKSIKDDIALSLNSLSVSYYNNVDSLRRTKEPLKIVKEALSFAASNEVKEKCNSSIAELELLAQEEPNDTEYNAIKSLERLRKECTELNILRCLCLYFDSSRAWLFWFKKERTNPKFHFYEEESTKIVEFVLSKIIQTVNKDLDDYDSNPNRNSLKTLVDHLEWGKSYIDIANNMTIDSEYRAKRFKENKDTLDNLLNKYKNVLNDLNTGRIRFISSEQQKQMEGQQERIKDIEKNDKYDTLKIVLFGMALLGLVIGLILLVS